MNYIEVKDAGNKLKERIVIRPESDIDLGYFMLFIVKKLTDAQFSSSPEHVFWFPDVQVKAKDIIVVYTKKGNNNKKENISGNTSYFYYWDLPTEQFTGEFIPVLVEAKGWVGVQNSDDEQILK